MKKLITLGVFVLLTNIAMAQKTTDAPAIIPPANNNEVDAQVKAHSNTNNNREAGGTPKVGTGTQPAGGVDTKKKMNLGKWLKKK